MDERQLKALIKKTAAKAEQKAKTKKSRLYDATLEATRKPDDPEAPPTPEGDLGDADDIFREMKKRSF